MGPSQPSFPEVLGGLGDIFQCGQTRLGIHQIQTSAVEGDVLGSFCLRPGPKEGVYSGRGRDSRAPHAFTAPLYDAF